MNPGRRGGAVLAAWLLFAGLIAPGSLRAQPRDLSAVPSSHYHVRTDLDRREAEEIARHMDRVFEEYERRFADFPVRQRATLGLFLFRTKADYVEHVRTMGYDVSNTAGAFYVSAGVSGLATHIDGQSREMLYHTLQHEGFHQFAWLRIGDDLPGWLNEGIAEYFGEAYIVGGKGSGGRGGRFRLGGADEARLKRLRRGLEEKRLIPLGDLATIPEAEWEARVAQADGVLMYDQAWSVVHFLIEGGAGEKAEDGGKKRDKREGDAGGHEGKYAGKFVEYLRAYASGLPPYPPLGRALGVEDYGALEAEWKRHLTTLEPDPVSTATTRLSFLARGLQALREDGVTPASMAELKEKLRAAGFKARRITHAGYVQLTAEDDAMFQVPPARAGDPPGEWQMLPNRTPTLPPSLRATVAGTEVSIRWSHVVGAGEVRGFVYRIEHK